MHIQKILAKHIAKVNNKKCCNCNHNREYYCNGCYEQTLLCAYDTLLPDSACKGPIAIFLENYLTQYAGEIRTMEVRNAMYLEEASGQWKRITGGTMHPNGGAYVKHYAGSYDYGAADGRLWIMTTGVGNRQDTARDPHVVWE